MIATIQTQNRSLVALIDDQKRQHETKRKEVEVLEQQLNRGIRLPYLVASIAEVENILLLLCGRLLVFLLKMMTTWQSLLRNRNLKRV